MWALKSPWISTFGICRNLLLYGNILFWLLSSTITTFITLQQTKINTSWLIHDRQWRNCVTTVTMAIWQSPKDNSRCAILKARVHAAMRLVLFQSCSKIRSNCKLPSIIVTNTSRSPPHTTSWFISLIRLTLKVCSLMYTSWSSANQISNFKFWAFFRVLFALWSLKYPHPKSQQTPWVSTEL